MFFKRKENRMSQDNNSSSNTAILDRMEAHIEKIRSKQHDDLLPGMPLYFNGSHTVNDCQVQGDVMVTVVAPVPEKWKDGDTLKVLKKYIPKGYQKVDDSNPTVQGKMFQLVPGNTEGARHCIENRDGVEIFVPENWSEENLDGPLLACSKPTVITHPVHGPVHVAAGMIVKIDYDRQWDLEQQKERRARD